MAYPEPILPLSGKSAKEFLEKLKNFKVSDEERTRLVGIAERVRKKMSP